MRKEDGTGTCVDCGEELGLETYPFDRCRRCLKKAHPKIYEYYVKLGKIKEGES